LVVLLLSVCTSCVLSDSVLILGGEIDDLLHPSLAEVEAFGSCGMFESNVPDLPHEMRDDTATLFGDSVVVCGGYKLLGPSKDCFALDLTAETLEWKEFPALIHARYMHGLVVAGGELYAVGGLHFIGPVRQIEKFNKEQNAWEEYGEMSGSRAEFCTLPLSDTEIIVLGGYDDLMNSNITEKYDLTTKRWTRLAYLPEGRDLHSCTWHNDEIVVAGGWIKNNIDNNTDVIPSNTIHKYSPLNNTWSEMPSMLETRTLFGLTSLNGILTAFGGWQLTYSDTVESFNEDLQSWELDAAFLSQKKGGFSFVNTGSYFADVECPDHI